MYKGKEKRCNAVGILEHTIKYYLNVVGALYVPVQ
nr:MAG TPA: hypothetical protein [Caudoviricetes sp.]